MCLHHLQTSWPIGIGSKLDFVHLEGWVEAESPGRLSCRSISFTKGGTPMLILPHTLAMVLGAFAPMFSKRVFEHVKVLLVGTILAPGQRTVTPVLRVMGEA
jgi:hypothetical protein